MSRMCAPKVYLRTVALLALGFLFLGAATGALIRGAGAAGPAPASDRAWTDSEKERIRKALEPPVRVLRMDPPSGSTFLPGPDGVLSVTVVFDRPGELELVECWGDITLLDYEPGGTRAEWVVRLGGGAGSPDPCGFSAVFRNADGERAQCLWGATSPSAGTDEAGSGAGTRRDSPRVLCFSPPAGSKVALGLDGALRLTVQFDRVPDWSCSGFGGNLHSTDILDTVNRIDGATALCAYKTYPGKEFWFRVTALLDGEGGGGGEEFEFWWPGYVRTEARLGTDATLARNIHRRAWEETLNEAAGDPVVRLGLYASRTLAVRHPEIYLRADRVFYETASSTKGFYELYLDDPPTWTFDPEALRKEEARWSGMFARAEQTGEPLSFQVIDFSRYRTIDRAEMFPEGVPLYDLLDLRVGFLPSVLKREGGRLTPLEAAFLRYFALGPSGSNYVVLCEDGSAYVRVGDVLLDPLTGRPARQSAPAVLVFNEAHVWYPMMGRDDTPVSGGLRAALAGLETASRERALGSASEDERRLLSRLEALTTLIPEEVPYAVMAASKARDRSLGYGLYREALSGVAFLPAGTADLESADWQEFTALGHTFQMASNRLSPLSAWIAAQALEDPLARTRAVTGLYYDLARTGPWTTARTVWQPELFWYDIEDSVLSRAGTCAIQAGIVSTLLDLAGVENYLVWFGRAARGGHETVYLPALGKEVSNGYLEEVEILLGEMAIPGKVYLIGAGSGGRFAIFGEEAVVATAAGADLERFLMAWADKFRQVKAFGTGGQWTYDDILELLETGAVEPVTIP